MRSNHRKQVLRRPPFALQSLPRCDFFDSILGFCEAENIIYFPVDFYSFNLVTFFEHFNNFYIGEIGIFQMLILRCL